MFHAHTHTHTRTHTTPHQVPCGSSAVYCPVASALPTPVTPGYYTIGSGARLRPKVSCPRPPATATAACCYCCCPAYRMSALALPLPVPQVLVPESGCLDDTAQGEDLYFPDRNR